MLRVKMATALIVTVWLASACETAPQTKGGVLYHGFSRIDPIAEEVVEDSWLVVRDGVITAMGVGMPSGGSYDAMRDMQKFYASPGLIDAHAHITAGPHRIQVLNDAPTVTIDSIDEITQFNAAIALAFGVTTVRNPGGDPEANACYDDNISAGTWIGPEAFHAGAVIQPPPFGGKAFAYPKTDAEWDEEARRQAELGATYFKLYVGLTEKELAKGIAAAHRHGLKAIAHLDRVSWVRAIELGIDGLEHALPTSPDLLEPEARAEFINQLSVDTKYLYRWFELVDFDGPLFQELTQAIVENDIDTNMTLLVNDMTFHVNDLDYVLPPEDHKYKHPATREGFLKFLSLGGTGWTPDDLARADEAMKKVLEFARRLHDAGAPMMIGTDGNGGGPEMAREMALHAKAGISSWAILRMATSRSAKRLGISERTGKLAPGFEADIAFFRSNIVQNLAEARNVAVVVNNGVEYTSEDLLVIAQENGGSNLLKTHD